MKILSPQEILENRKSLFSGKLKIAIERISEELSNKFVGNPILIELGGEDPPFNLIKSAFSEHWIVRFEYSTKNESYLEFAPRGKYV